jgi:glycosyltransferase involved in cell wall biosynthesis
MAHAIPVLAHPIACEGINVTAGKNVIFAESAASFAEKILELVAADSELTRIGDGGYDLIKQKYDFSQIGNLLAELFSNTARAKPAPTTF